MKRTRHSLQLFHVSLFTSSNIILPRGCAVDTHSLALLHLPLGYQTLRRFTLTFLHYETKQEHSSDETSSPSFIICPSHFSTFAFTLYLNSNFFLKEQEHQSICAPHASTLCPSPACDHLSAEVHPLQTIPSCLPAVTHTSRILRHRRSAPSMLLCTANLRCWRWMLRGGALDLGLRLWSRDHWFTGVDWRRGWSLSEVLVGWYRLGGSAWWCRGPLGMGG